MKEKYFGLNQPDGQLKMPWDNARLFVIPCSIPSQLQDLSSQVLHHCRHVDGSPGADSLGVVPLPKMQQCDKRGQGTKRPEQPMNAPDWELQTSPAGA